jgi:acyl-CoA dehydrogenase
MDFEIPSDLQDLLDQMDAFIETRIKPLEQQDDNIRFFDHRREDARTDWERGGLPNEEWEQLLHKVKRMADEAGFYRYPFPKEYGGMDGSNLGMAVIREHLAAKGLGLHNDLQNEHSIVGNNVGLLLMLNYGTEEQKKEWVDHLLNGTRGFAFGITEPKHGSDATHMETVAVRDGDEWVINGEKTWNTGIHKAQYDLIFARTSGKAGDGTGITAFLTPTNAPGFKIEQYLWTFNMPTDHAHVSFKDIRVPHSAIFGGEGRGLEVVQAFFNENRIRQAASSLGAAQYCVNEAVRYAQERKPFGKPLSTNQAIQFPLVELQTQCEMLRALIHKTAWLMDKYGAFSQSDKVSMCNYYSNRLCCEAADRAMQVFGGHGLLAAHALRAHLPAPPPLPHHRRRRGDPDASGGRLHVRLHEPAGAQGCRRDRRQAGSLCGMSAGAGAAASPEAAADDFDKALANVLARTLDGFEALLSAERLSGGASQETYRLTVRAEGGERRLCLRRSPGGIVREPSPGHPSVATEAQLMQEARAVGVPEPRVYAVLDPATDGLGEGFLMEWLDGETLGARINRSPELADAREKLAFECGQTLARLHAIDLDATGLRQQLSEMTPEFFVRQTWENYQSFGTPQPMIDYAARWLLDHLPDDPELVLVHSDFRNGNIMVGPQGLVAVLDWEIAHIGDPMRDLGWLCTASWRFGRPELPVGGFGTREQLFEGYESVSGRPVDRDRVTFWEVFGSFWWAVGCLGMAQHYRTGPDATVERPAIGRRSSECQADCVNLLIPGPVALPEAADPSSSTVDMPRADELLEGVRDFLRNDVMGVTDGRTNFLARVAANAVDIVIREQALGPAAKAAERERLARVLGQDGDLETLRWKVVHGLRGGELPLDTPGLAEALRHAVVAQLAIDQPRYHALGTALAGSGAV